MKLAAAEQACRGLPSSATTCNPAAGATAPAAKCIWQQHEQSESSRPATLHNTVATRQTCNRSSSSSTSATAVLAVPLPSPAPGGGRAEAEVHCTVGPHQQSEHGKSEVSRQGEGGGRPNDEQHTRAIGTKLIRPMRSAIQIQSHLVQLQCHCHH